MENKENKKKMGDSNPPKNKYKKHKKNKYKQNIDKQKHKENKNIQEYILFFDGANGVPPSNLSKEEIKGKAGSGAIIYRNGEIMYSKKEIPELGRIIGLSPRCIRLDNPETSTTAEFYGLIIGLDSAIKLNIKKLQVYGDCKDVINWMNGAKGWDYKREIKSQYYRLYNIAKKLQGKFDEIEFLYIKREYNEIADALSNYAAGYKGWTDDRIIEELKKYNKINKIEILSDPNPEKAKKNKTYIKITYKY